MNKVLKIGYLNKTSANAKEKSYTRNKKCFWYFNL